MVKKFENFDYEEEEDEPIFSIVGFYIGQQPTDNTFFILEENIDENNMILLNGFRHSAGGLWNVCKYVPTEHIKQYIYTNRLPINIWNEKSKNFNKVYWDDIPSYIKDNL